MKKNIYKLFCVLALSATLAVSAFAAKNEVDIWVSKLFTLPAPTVTNEQTGLVVKVENPGIPYGLDCQIGTALYDTDGRFLDTKFVASDSSENYTFTFAANDKVAKVKLFVFEASSGFKPIYQASQTLLP